MIDTYLRSQAAIAALVVATLAVRGALYVSRVLSDPRGRELRRAWLAKVAGQPHVRELLVVLSIVGGFCCGLVIAGGTWYAATGTLAADPSQRAAVALWSCVLLLAVLCGAGVESSIRVLTSR